MCVVVKQTFTHRKIGDELLMAYGERDVATGQFAKSDGATTRKIRFQDMVMMVCDHPGWTLDEVYLRMLSIHGLTLTKTKAMLEEAVRLKIFEVRAVKLATDDPQAPQLGMGYYPLENAKLFYGER